MLVRVIDYVANPGGGIRYVMELMQGLLHVHPEANFELVSHGAALSRYRVLMGENQLKVKLRDIKPLNNWEIQSMTGFGIRGLSRLTRLLGFWIGWHYFAPREVFKDCDVVWLPWVHRHRIPIDYAEKTIGSFHDAILLQFPELFEQLVPTRYLIDERETTRRWVTSQAKLIVSSMTTMSILTRLFESHTERYYVIPISGEHSKISSDDSMNSFPANWRWAQHPYLFYPANIFPHKNHEILFEGVGKWGCKYPLVLTGEGTDLRKSENHIRRVTDAMGLTKSERGTQLRRFAETHGMQIGTSLFALGYVSDVAYYALLKQAWALLMPTLAEGGGSFPVYEALLCGIPVISADIPVLKEQVERTGGNVMWFDPRSSQDLADKLNDLQRHYQKRRSQATAQVANLYRRSWTDVAEDYWNVFRETANIRYY